MSYNYGEIGVNVDTYSEEVQTISKDARLQIYDIFCTLIQDPDAFHQQKTFKSGIDTYHLIHTLNDIKFYHVAKNKWWQNNAGSVIVEANNKKYFCKLYNYENRKYDPYKDPSREVVWLTKTQKEWYNIIKPIMYYKNNDMWVIVYPYVPELQTFTERVMKKWMWDKEKDYKEKIEKASIVMEQKWVKDIKRGNTHIDSDWEIHFFDTIYLWDRMENYKEEGSDIL